MLIAWSMEIKLNDKLAEAFTKSFDWLHLDSEDRRSDRFV
jgi:hypothetical protein